MKPIKNPPPIVPANGAKSVAYYYTAITIKLR